MKTSRVLALVMGLALVSAWACGRTGDELSAADAASALGTSPDFAVRQGSLTGRQVVEVLAVRRIGRSATEVEFTWRNFPTPPGEAARLKTSMALFRMQGDGRWMLASLYKID